MLWPAPFALSDHQIFVEAGRLVMHGRSPYDDATWAALAREIGSPHMAGLAETTGVWPHPPWTAYAFVPFALLPRALAPWALHLVLVAAGLGAVLLAVRTIRPAAAVPAAPGLAGIDALALVIGLTFQPLVIGIRWGQLSSLLSLGLMLVLLGLRGGRTAPIVAGALLLALKPHVLVALAVVAALLVIRRAPRAAAICAAALGLPAALSLARHPEWLGAAGAGYAARVEGLATYASTYALAIDLARDAWPAVAAALIALAVVACAAAVRSARSADPAWSLAAAAVVSLAVVPYVWPYDHAILLPAALLSLAAAARVAGPARTLHLGLAVAAFSALPWLLFLLSAPRPTQALGAFVPLAAAGMLLLAGRRTRAPATH